MSDLESIGLEVPNLDCFTADPQEVRDLGALFTTLALYCDEKATAMQHRLAGLIEAALAYETECETIYKQLPKWARW